MGRVGLIDDVELGDRLAFVVAQERVRRAQAGPERRGDLRGIGADHREVAVVHVELALQVVQVPQLALALRSPVAPAEAQDERVPRRELGEPHRLQPVIGQFEIGKVTADDEVSTHACLL